MLEEKDWQEDDAEMTEMTEMTKKMRETWGESAISLRVEVGIVGLVASCGCRRRSRGRRGRSRRRDRSLTLLRKRRRRRNIFFLRPKG